MQNQLTPISLIEVVSASEEVNDDADSSDLATVVDSGRLFRGNREIVIEHQGERYRLRITRRNKLILQK